MVSSAGTRGRRPRSAWSRFARRWGWRAYALPILTVVTVVALVESTPSGHGSRDRAADAAGQRTAGAAAHKSSAVAVEGFNSSEAGFAAGSTPPPAPAVIDLGSDAVSCSANSYDRLVLVSIKRQHLWACEGAKEVRSTAVTTGALVHHDQTPLGSWRVQAKQRDRYLVGPGYRDYVHYWVPFNGDFGLHDAPWQKMPFGSKDWTTGGSHGCVHLPSSTMAWMYHWAKVGSTVVTVES